MRQSSSGRVCDTFFDTRKTCWHNCQTLLPAGEQMQSFTLAFSFRIIGFCHFTVIKLLLSAFLTSFLLILSLSHRLQQEQAAKQTQQSHQPVCGGKQQPNASSENRISAADNGGEDNDYESTSDETVELWSHEIPVWIKGEQRYISGVTDQTTCLDLIEALLIDEGVIKGANDSNNNGGGANLYPTRVNDFVIVERWRRVEQVLDPRTKVLKIWTAWGAEQPEVSIHPLDGSFAF